MKSVFSLAGAIVLALILYGVGSYLVGQVTTDKFDVPNSKMATDLDGHIVNLPYGQNWWFEPTQAVELKSLQTKSQDGVTVVVAKVNSVATVQEPPAAEKANNKEVKKSKLRLSGLMKLSYEKVDEQWFLVGVDGLDLKATPEKN